jgi:hypothetical protein
MMLLVYISGVLTTVGIVLVIASVRVYKKYKLLLESNQHISNISSIRDAENKERMGEIEEIVRVIQNDYVPNGDLSEKILNILEDIKHLSNSIDSNSKRVEDVWRQSKNEFMSLNNRVQKLGEDPNFISKY